VHAGPLGRRAGGLQGRRFRLYGFWPNGRTALQDGDRRVTINTEPSDSGRRHPQIDRKQDGGFSELPICPRSVERAGRRRPRAFPVVCRRSGFLPVMLWNSGKGTGQDSFRLQEFVLGGTILSRQVTKWNPGRSEREINPGSCTTDSDHSLRIHRAVRARPAKPKSSPRTSYLTRAQCRNGGDETVRAGRPIFRAGSEERGTNEGCRLFTSHGPRAGHRLRRSEMPTQSSPSWAYVSLEKPERRGLSRREGKSRFSGNSGSANADRAVSRAFRGIACRLWPTSRIGRFTGSNLRRVIQSTRKKETLDKERSENDLLGLAYHSGARQKLGGCCEILLVWVNCSTSQYRKTSFSWVESERGVDVNLTAHWPPNSLEGDRYRPLIEGQTA